MDNTIDIRNSIIFRLHILFHYPIGVLFVAEGTSGTILTSGDGTTWSSRTSGTSKLLSMESTLIETHSHSPLWNDLPLLRIKTERIFRIGKPESVVTPLSY
ncbi:MAG: hypothetical protein ABGY12_10580 [Candidatus Lambdaproteobacteria bacterium]